MTDIQAKYQKLAAEYAKLRAQVPVLKKAVVDEQQKEEELREIVKGKDQSIRKYEQEVDSLGFRNHQLEARVSVLQEEFELMQAKNKKHKKNAPVQNDSISRQDSVLGEELQSKIEENARLHKQLHDASKEHQEKVYGLEDRLSQLESDAKKHDSVLKQATEESRERICKLQEDRMINEVKLQKLDKEHKKVTERSNTVERELQVVQDELGAQLAAATQIIKDKLAFNDSIHSEMNAFNVPSHDRQHQLQTKELVGQASMLVHEMVQGFLNFYSYSEQRSRVYPADADLEPLSDVNKKFCQLLHTNASVLRPIEQSFVEFNHSLREDTLTTLETAAGLQNFASKFKCFSAYASKILPYQMLSLEEESNVSSCTNSLQTKNADLQTSMKALVSAIEKLNTYVQLLAYQSSGKSEHPRTCHKKIFELFSQALVGLHEAIKDVSKHYNGKVSLEHQLPTATQKLRITGECIISALISLVTCTSKMSTFFAGNLEFFSKTVGYMVRGTHQCSTGPTVHPAVNSLRLRAAHYMSRISRSCPDSVPYKCAIENRKTLFSSTESRDSLAQQVLKQQEQLTKLEQEREHWMLESQLLTMKLEKESKRVSSLEKQIKIQTLRESGSIEDNLEAESMAAATAATASAPGGPLPATTETSLLGGVERVGSGGDGSTEANRELLIKQHYMQRIADLTSKLQLADSKALNFHAECRALHKRLSLAYKEKEGLKTEVKMSSQSIAQLKDELQTTAKSYEGQLSMMSEHLAGMNEKLALQKDEIDALKHQMRSKSSKRGLPKLGR